MSEQKKIRVNVRKKKINIKKLLIFLLIFGIVFYLIYLILNKPISNIYIIDNNNINDNEIIKLAKIDNYPSFLLTFKSDIKKRLLTNEYIKNVNIKKEFFGQLYIYITEKKILFNDSQSNMLILEDGSYVDNIYDIYNYPVLSSSLDEDIYKELIEKFNLVSIDILQKISEVVYSPLEVDKKRFLLYMNDGNVVYITLSKIDVLNKYNSIYKELDNKKGILNLDLGNSFEIKEG